MVVLYTLRGKGSNRWSMKVLTYVRRREGIPQGFQISVKARNYLPWSTDSLSALPC